MENQNVIINQLDYINQITKMETAIDRLEAGFKRLEVLLEEYIATKKHNDGETNFDSSRAGGLGEAP